MMPPRGAVVFLHADPEVQDKWMQGVMEQKLEIGLLVLVSTNGIRMRDVHPKIRACRFQPKQFSRANRVVAQFLENLEHQSML